MAERRDVLCALCGLLTLWAYVRYAERPGLARYLSVVLWLALGLLAKPMLVTLPAVLLLLDYWPLRRWQRLRRAPADSPASGLLAVAAFSFSRLLWEKAPLLALALGSSVVTLFAQRVAMISLEQWPLDSRLENAVIAYVKYLGLTFWPSGLAPFYPRQPAPLGQVLMAGLLLLVLSALVLWAGRRRPYLPVGWLWFVGMLLPVIGLVQVGPQAMADRFTYLPHIGLFLLLVWGGYDLLARWRGGRVLAAVLAGGVVAACMAVTRVQTCYWTDSVTLWTHAVKVTAPNPLTYELLGEAYTGENQYEKAAFWLAKAIGLGTNNPKGQFELGTALVNLGRPREAEEHLLLALQLEPERAATHLELGGAFMREGRTAEAAPEFREALRLEPGWGLAHLNLGMALAMLGKEDEALGHLDECARLDPHSVIAQNYRGLLLADRGDWSQAVAAFRAAVQWEPANVGYHLHLAQSLVQAGETEAGRAEYRAAFELDPDWPRKVNQEAPRGPPTPSPTASTACWPCSGRSRSARRRTTGRRSSWIRWPWPTPGGAGSTRRAPPPGRR